MKEEEERRELARVIGYAIRCKGIQARTQDTKILADYDGVHAHEQPWFWNFNHYILNLMIDLQKAETDREQIIYIIWVVVGFREARAKKEFLFWKSTKLLLFMLFALKSKTKQTLWERERERERERLIFCPRPRALTERISIFIIGDNMLYSVCI